MAVAGLAGCLVWLCTRPIWVIYKPEQVKIEGTRFLPVQAIRGMLPISYPQSLLRLEPQAIAQELKAKAPISDVLVSRQLFPPSLTVRIRERYPVAIALLSQADVQLLKQRSTKDRSGTSRVWLLDSSGMQLPLENPSLLERTIKLPSLKVIGNPEHYQANWSKLYQETSRSPVKISDIDFQNPANLVLKTELGIIHLGPFSSRFPEQVKALDRIRDLPRRVSLSQIAYIDLRNPKTPFMQLIGSKDTAKSEDSPKSDLP